MRIIKKGVVPPPIRKYILITCDNCGTVYELERSDLDSDSPSYHCYCRSNSDGTSISGYFPCPLCRNGQHATFDIKDLF